MTATGSGPLTYQWRFNGVNITGATNASLVLSSVSAASQGVYTVLIRDGTAAAISSGAVLSVYELAVTGQWDFERGDLRATVGSDLEYLGDTATLTTFPSPEHQRRSLPGSWPLAATRSSQGFSMRHGAKPNGGGHFVNQYTLLMDVMFPAASSGQWRALFQTDPFNHDGNDAEFYVGNSASAPDPNGLGADGQFNGSLAPDTWYRIAFAVDLAAPAGRQLAKYVNGVKVAEQSLSGGVDGRYALGPTALLFTAGISGGGFTQPGFVSSIQFVNGWMSPEAIAALGGPSAGKLPPGNAAIRVTNITAQLLPRQPGLDRARRSVPGPDRRQPDPSGLADRSPTRAAIAPSPSRCPAQPTSTGSCSSSPTSRSASFRIREQSLPSKQILRAPGQQLQFGGRPVDLALSPDGKTVFIKNMSNLLVVDAASWTLLQTLELPGQRRFDARHRRQPGRLACLCDRRRQ